MYNLETSKDREKFIANMESSLYEGTNIDGERVIVLLDKGLGMTVKTQKKEKPRWYEVVNYDKEGYQESVTYEAIEK